jgi:hypothetical protein
MSARELSKISRKALARFNPTVLAEKFREAFRKQLYESVEALQRDLDEWILGYNTKRTHLGYRNMGKEAHRTDRESPNGVLVKKPETTVNKADRGGK